MCSKKESIGRPASRIPGPRSGQEDGGRLPFQLRKAFGIPRFWNNTTQNLTWSKWAQTASSEGRGQGPQGSGMLVKLLKQRTTSLLHFKLYNCPEPPNRGGEVRASLGGGVGWGGTVARHTQACLDGRWGTRERFFSWRRIEAT